MNYYYYKYMNLIIIHQSCNPIPSKIDHGSLLLQCENHIQAFN